MRPCCEETGQRKEGRGDGVEWEDGEEGDEAEVEERKARETEREETAEESYGVCWEELGEPG